MKLILALILGYLIGSVSSGILIARIFGHMDIRKAGSGNPGTTNILRVMGKKYALLTFVCDFLKGVLGAFIGVRLGGLLGGAVGGIGTVAGHNYPLYFGFKGGKGIATSFGALLTVLPAQTLCAFAAFLAVTAATRYVSAGSITAAVVLPLLTCLTPGVPATVRLIVVAYGALAIWRHRQNIVRLMHHEENRLSFGKK